MRFFHIPVQSFQVKIEFSQKRWFEFFNIEFDCHQTLQLPVIKQKINRIIVQTYLQSVFLAQVGEIFAQRQ